MQLDPIQCYEAIKARDARFDGRFFVGVSTTGVYCRPVCTARTPGRDRCRFFAHAAAAEDSGFRPCLRCRPELAPGAAPVDAPRSAARWIVGRIESGAMNDADLESLAREYGLSSRQLRRAVVGEFGVTPVQLAQTRRLLLAKQLLTETRLPMTAVAHASGFSSVRRFNALFGERYGLNPQRFRRSSGESLASEGVTLRLAYRPPLAWPELRGFLVGRGAAGVEAAEGDRYLRTVSLEGRRGWITAAPVAARNLLAVEISSELVPVLAKLLPRLRRLFDLDAHPAAIAQTLAADARLAPMVAACPGLRVAGALDGFELALRAVLGQQVTVKAATTLFGRFARAFGDAAQTPHPALMYFAPQAARVAEAPVQQLIDLGLTQRRAQTVSDLARAVAGGTLDLDGGTRIETALERLLEIPGIGPWTAQYVAMRALRDPDAFPSSDYGVMKALDVVRPAHAQQAAEGWRPWRAYGALHLWRSLAFAGG
jgi:AraC family transcriptional regulator of adaptative response / DNA-3-methyladenine glycosylase II